MSYTHACIQCRAANALNVDDQELRPCAAHTDRGPGCELCGAAAADVPLRTVRMRTNTSTLTPTYRDVLVCADAHACVTRAALAPRCPYCKRVTDHELGNGNACSLCIERLD